MKKRKKLVTQTIPSGPTIVWKKNSRTGKMEPKQVMRKGYQRTVKVNK